MEEERSRSTPSEGPVPSPEERSGPLLAEGPETAISSSTGRREVPLASSAEETSRPGRATEGASPRRRRGSPQGDEWVAPRRIALIVAFALSLALFLGTAAALLKIPGTLPWSGALALVSGIFEVPTLLFFVVGREAPTIRTSPLLLIAGGGGLTSYFVGGAVGIGSPTTLGAGVIALVLFLLVGHRPAEGLKRRIRRVRRWSRNGVILGVVLLLLALGLYTVYGASPSVQPISSTSLQDSQTLQPGSNFTVPASGAAGDELYLLFGSDNSTANIQATFLTSGGSTVASSANAGSYSAPGLLELSLQAGSESYRIRVSYLPTFGAPPQVTIRYTEGDIPAEDVALGAAVVPSGWCGFILLIVGTTMWITSRPPSEVLPTPAAAGPPPEGPASAPVPVEAEAPTAPSETSPAPSPEGTPSQSPREEPPAPPPGNLSSSDEGRTTSPDESSDVSSVISK